MEMGTIASPWRYDGGRDRARLSTNFRRRDTALRRLSRLRLVYRLDAVKNFAEIAPCNLNVIVVLQIEPSCALVPSALASRSAVPAVMPVCSLAIRSIRVRGKPQALASAPADIF